MNIGMLWCDNDPRADLSAKIARAAEVYRRRYGSSPDLCYVHPSLVQPDGAKNSGIEVRGSRQLKPEHLWLGVKGLVI